jgi:ribosomal protein L16 Arg81 hydroxylase
MPEMSDTIISRHPAGGHAKKHAKKVVFALQVSGLRHAVVDT